MIARRRKRSKRWISWLLFLILVIVAGVVCYLVWDNYFNDKKGGEGEPESAVIDKDKERKEENENKDKEESEIIKKEEVVQYDGEDPNLGDELTGVITYAGVNGGKLMIRVNINQYLSSGSCVLRIVSQGGALAFSDTANIVNAASTSTCEGFDVSTGELSGGTYNIYVDLNADGKTGTISGGVSI